MNVYLITIKKTYSTYQYYAVADSFEQAVTIKRPDDWSCGKIVSIEILDKPVLVQQEDK